MKNKIAFKNMYKKAYTLPELLIVLIIIGIVAPTAMSMLDIEKLKGKAYIAASKKVLQEFDEATQSILLDQYETTGTAKITNCSDDNLVALYSKKMKVSRKATSTCLGLSKGIVLENGACIGFLEAHGSADPIIFPGETDTKDENIDCSFVDIQALGEKGPHKEGFDLIYIPLNKDGISYGS